MVGSGQGSIVREGQGKRFDFPFGNRGEVKGDVAAGLSFGFFRSTLPPGAGMPFLHVHRSMDEAFYIAGGEVEYRLGDRYETGEAGAGVLIPAGVPHCFRAVGDVAATVVVMTGDPRGVDMIVELAAAGQGDPARFATILAKYDSELLETRPHWTAS